ncbi:MAG: orotate phosphoribosyltransferase [Candidatus Hydrothermarchaeales archaeon]
MYSKPRLVEILRERALERGEFTLASGKKSPYYIDVKKAYTDPKVLKMIAEGMNEAIGDEEIDRVAGVEVGAVPLAAALSLESGIPFVMIRKGVRMHGTGRRVEGELNPGEKVVIVEDVTTTGASVASAVNVIRREGGICDKVIAVVDRLEGASENLKKLNIALVSLVTMKDL